MSRTRLALAVAAGAVAIALVAVAGYLGTRKPDLTGWTAYRPDAIADLFEHPLGAHATAWWWGGAGVVIALACGALLAGGRAPTMLVAVALVVLCVLFGGIDLYAGKPEIPGDADPWWLLGAGAVAAVGVALAPRAHPAPPEKRATSD